MMLFMIFLLYGNHYKCLFLFYMTTFHRVNYVISKALDGFDLFYDLKAMELTPYAYSTDSLQESL